MQVLFAVNELCLEALDLRGERIMRGVGRDRGRNRDRVIVTQQLMPFAIEGIRV